MDLSERENRRFFFVFIPFVPVCHGASFFPLNLQKVDEHHVRLCTGLIDSLLCEGLETQEDHGIGQKTPDETATQLRSVSLCRFSTSACLEILQNSRRRVCCAKMELRFLRSSLSPPKTRDSFCLQASLRPSCSIRSVCALRC